MKRTWRIGSLVAAAVVALAVFGMPAQTEALSITNVTVTVTINGTSQTYNSTTTGWTFPVSLTGGQDLVLTQDGGSLGAYSFDTSDVGAPLPTPFPAGGFARTASITVTADGTPTTFSNATIANIFSLNGQDPGGTAFNEAQPYTLIGTTGGYQIFLGYADTAHTNACGSGATTVGLTGNSACLPDPFSTATHFEGIGGPNNGGANHGTCTGATTNGCYDAAVLRIVALTPIPEPASMMLLGTGLVGLAARYRRKANKQ